MVLSIMSERKFRAWDKQRNRMSKPFKLGDQFLEWEDGIDLEMPLVFFLSKERGEIMPCTELLDINRKEIYEGDIVRRYKYARDENEYNIGQIVQYELWHGFTYKQIKDARTHPCEGDLTVDQCIPLSNSRVTSLEIIGNIYENPELLS